MQTNYHPSTGWLPPPGYSFHHSHDVMLSPSSWSDPESRQESPGSMASKAIINNTTTLSTHQSPFVEANSSSKLSKGPLRHEYYSAAGPNSEDHNHNMFASPQQTQRSVLYPSDIRSEPRAPYGNQNNIYPQQPLPSPQAVYDDPMGPHSNSSIIMKQHQQPGEMDNSESLFPSVTNALYSSWIEQQERSPTKNQGEEANNHALLDPLQQSHSSLSMASPVPRRSIWSTSDGDRGASKKSPLAPPSVYRPQSKAEAEDLGMTRLSLLSNSPMMVQNQQQQHIRGSTSSSNSSYSTGLPGLVHASSGSTASASLPSIYTNNNNGSHINNSSNTVTDDDAANVNILQSSLRSFLDDEEDCYSASSPTVIRSIVAGPPGFESPPQPPRQTVGSNKMASGGNANTRRNRNRNKSRQQKKGDQHHHNHPLQQERYGGHMNRHRQQHEHPAMSHHNALKERNSFTNHGLNDTALLEPLFEKPYQPTTGAPAELAPLAATGTSSLKRAVAAQQQNRSSDPFTRTTGNGSEALRMLLGDEPSEHSASNLKQSVLDLESSYNSMHPGSSSSLRMSGYSPGVSPHTPHKQASILPLQMPPPIMPFDFSLSNMYNQDNSTNSSEDDDDFILMQHIMAGENQQQGGEDVGSHNELGVPDDLLDGHSPTALGKKREWLLRMNKKLQEVPVGELDPSVIPISAIMNAWAKTKSAQGASMVEMWLKRAQEEYSAGNHRIVPTSKMYTMAVDAWARSGELGAAANRAEDLLHHMNALYQTGEHDKLKPTTGIFNAVINAWARSREKIAPVRAEQILSWMENYQDADIRPDKYTYNTVIHAWAKAGGTEAAVKAQQLLSIMDKKYREGNIMAKPDTITYNVVINAWAKSGGRGAALEAEKLLSKMHKLHEMGDADVKPSVVTYGAVIDAYAKSGEKGSAARADTLLAHMIQLHQSDPIKHADMLPNTYVFNTVINCWAKSKEHDSASKAEEMLVAMSRLHASGIPNLKPDAFTYTAVIDAWAKSGYRGAASRADQLLDKMEAKYLAGDADLKPNTFTYNAVINALAKSGEVGAAARAERVLQNMVNRYRAAGSDDVKPTTINFNTVLDAWAKSGGGRAAAERAEEILEWMDRLYKGGNPDVKPDTITFNAVLDAWARSGDRVAPHRAEQILDHMDDLYRAGNRGVKPDTYTYNTLINAWAKSGGRGAAARAENVLSVMNRRYKDGDADFKPNTRTHTSVIDAWAKSGEKGAARRAEQILNNMISHYEATGDADVKPNVHTANAVCNACAFTKMEEDRAEAMQIAFRVFDWLSSQPDMCPDSYTYTILLSVCANLLPKEDSHTRYMHARSFFDSCREAGHVNDYVLRKLRQTVTEDEYLGLVDYRMDTSAASMPASWTRNAKINNHAKGRKGVSWSNRRGKK